MKRPAFINIFFLSDCGVDIKISQRQTLLTTRDKVASGCTASRSRRYAKKRTGQVFKDTGFSTDFGFNSNLVKARDIVRKYGENIIKVAKNRKPDIWNSCNRMQVE